MAEKWLWMGGTNAGQVVKTYSLGGRPVAVNRGGEWIYLFQDHLGSPALETDYDGRAGFRWKYEPYGTMRASEWTLPIDRGFTGQVIEPGLGLHDYGARHYAQPLGRWIAGDTIVPEPGNPQALNRYSYVLNNPLRYTDPTGMFSEDEIMGYLGVSTWDDVLAMFGEGGVMAGAWGFLEVLRQAELGTPISMWFDVGSAEPINPLYRPTLALLRSKLHRNRIERETSKSEAKYLRVEARWAIGFGMILLTLMSAAVIIAIAS